MMELACVYNQEKRKVKSVAYLDNLIVLLHAMAI